MLNSLIEKLAIISFPTVESLTADRAFFDGSIQLTPDVVSVFVKKYEDNGTMLNLINSWLERNNDSNEYTAIQKRIVSPEQKAKIYRDFAVSAFGMLEKIHGGACSTWELENWANSDFAADLFAKLGTGMALSDISTSRVPAEAKNLFDGYKLDPNDSGASAVIQYTPVNRS